jgi:hypothetical protein
MDKKGSVQGTVLLYVVLMIVLIIIVIIVLELFTPYKFSNLIDSFISAASHSGGGQYA